MPPRLGQHFLTDPSILDRIVAALDPQPDDVVLEIGPGKGTLTRRLAPRVGRVIAIERDRALVDRARGMGHGAWGLANVTLVQGDALELDWGNLPTPHVPCPMPPFKLIGNIPYAITTPLIEQALTPPLPRLIVFLVQREVAERLAAPPGSKAYGALSIGVQVAATVERLFAVPAGAFRPPPRVHSAAVRLVPRAQPLITPERHPAFRRFVTSLFGQRRKQLRRSLRATLDLDREAAARLLARVGIDPSQRVEVLTPEQVVILFETVALRKDSQG